MLYSLILIPLFIALYLILQRRRKRIAANYQTLSTASEISKRDPGLRRHIPPIFFLLSLAILGVALARPQTEVSLPHIEGTVILAFDVSGSMAADDFKPTRMEAAKTAAKNFVDHQPTTVRIGVVAFSDNGLTVQTPTNDQDAILMAINRLAPERGTSLASGILASLKAIDVGAGQPSEIYTNLTPVPTLTPTPVPQGTYAPAVIVLLTDGENNENPDPLAAAQTAANRGVRIYTVGIGSAAGTNLHINGFIVHTQLDERHAETNFADHRWNLLQRGERAGFDQDLQQLESAIGGHAGGDRGHFHFCGRQHSAHVDRRHVFVVVV